MSSGPLLLEIMALVCRDLIDLFRWEGDTQKQGLGIFGGISLWGTEISHIKINRSLIGTLLIW
jgi:hypothetical protein